MGVGCRGRTEGLFSDVVAKEVQVREFDGTLGSSDGVLDSAVLPRGHSPRNIPTNPQV